MLFVSSVDHIFLTLWGKIWTTTDKFLALLTHINKHDWNDSLLFSKSCDKFIWAIVLKSLKGATEWFNCTVYCPKLGGLGVLSKADAENGIFHDIHNSSILLRAVNALISDSLYKLAQMRILERGENDLPVVGVSFESRTTAETLASQSNLALGGLHGDVRRRSGRTPRGEAGRFLLRRLKELHWSRRHHFFVFFFSGVCPPKTQQYMSLLLLSNP